MRSKPAKSSERSFDREALSDAMFEKLQALPIQLSQQQFEKLLDYLALLHKWNSIYNLTSIRDPELMVTQHLLDSLAVVPAFENARNVLDVGAGGGLPGMVLAIARPDMQVSLIDTVQKKTAFLNQVRIDLNLTNVTVYTGRVEDLESENDFDVITSRAFASLGDMVSLSGHLLVNGGRFIAMKGLIPKEEIADLPKGWVITNIKEIKVPGLNAERHLINIEKETACPEK